MKIFLRKGFSPIDKNIFKLNTKVDFNCYIQRFNGYAIIVEAGTLLDEKVYKMLTNNELQVYVEIKNYENYKEYALENKDKKNFIVDELELDKEIQKCITIENVLYKENSANAKLKSIYSYGKNLLNAWLKKKNETFVSLPIEALNVLAENLVEIVSNDVVSGEIITLSSFNEFIEHNYSLTTHLLNVSFFASLVGYQLGLDLKKQKQLVVCAFLHDIGKSSIDERLINKADLLNEDEFKLVKLHTVKGVNLATKSGVKDAIILKGISQHHEFLNGSGYPNAFSKNSISEFAQIIAVCDVFNALITVKPYRGAYSTFNALGLIKDEFQNKLNMTYVNILIKLLK